MGMGMEEMIWWGVAILIGILLVKFLFRALIQLVLTLILWEAIRQLMPFVMPWFIPFFTGLLEHFFDVGKHSELLIWAVELIAPFIIASFLGSLLWGIVAGVFKRLGKRTRRFIL